MFNLNGWDKMYFQREKSKKIFFHSHIQYGMLPHWILRQKYISNFPIRKSNYIWFTVVTRSYKYTKVFQIIYQFWDSKLEPRSTALKGHFPAFSPSPNLQIVIKRFFYDLDINGHYVRRLSLSFLWSKLLSIMFDIINSW